MQDLCSEDHLARCSIDQRQASRLAARIKLDPKWFKWRHLHFGMQNEYERVAPQNCCLALFQQEASITRMDRIKWLLVGIHDEYFGHR